MLVSFRFCDFSNFWPVSQFCSPIFYSVYQGQWFGFHTFRQFPFPVLLWWPVRKQVIFCIIFIKICHKNGYKFLWKTRGGFLEFALFDVEADNNRKQCSIYITFRREEQVTWSLAPGFILSTSKESLILRLQCINYKYYFLFSDLFIFSLFILWYLNLKITRVHVLECSIKSH